ncbi:MAG: hypothetical protein ABMA64_27220 [Myxococcota bacterium]
MGAQLRIAVLNYMEGTSRAAAVADVIPISPGGGTRLRDVVIPAGTGPDRTVVNVTPGRYLVQTSLPSGELLDAEVEVAEGGETDVVLKGDVTPHEWLGWHRFTSSRSAMWQGPEANFYPAEITLGVAHPEAWRHGPPYELWPDWPPHRGYPPFFHRPPFMWIDRPPASRRDSRVQIFEFRRPEIPWYPEWVRVFAWVKRTQATWDCVCLPVPWGRQETAVVQLAVPHDPRLPLSIAVQDAEFGAVLAYISSGSVPSARRMLPDYCLDLLADKYENPFGAAAAAHVLLQTTVTPEREAWHHWIENLAERFSWLPDGAVLMGHLAGRQGRPDVAAKWFLVAFERGIPVLTSSTMLLHNGLLALEGSENARQEALMQALDVVRHAMGRLHVTVPFSSVRLHGGELT